MAHVYMLECSDGTFYIGSTVDLDRRIQQHSSGFGAAYTRRRLPVTLAWSEHFERVEDAFRWEKRLQGWSHAKRRLLIEGGMDAVRGWSAAQRREKNGR